MSYFDDASLVMIPSGYKTSKVYSVKPTDGSGDLTFSRSNDTATRVNSAGLIEKVRTNLLLQSNTLNVTWTTPNVSVTGGQTDPDGGTTAWLVTETVDGGSLRQAITATGSLTFSFTLKANTGTTSATLFCTDAAQNAAFDLSNGTFSESGAVAKMVSLGNGWYRCSISFTASAASTLILFPSSGAVIGSCFATKAQLETGDIATDYIATTSAAVSVGPVANVPRLDYLNSSCPRLLLEPQRTNLFAYSEQLDNAYWSKIGAITVTANNAVSPDGYQNADLVTGAGGGARIQRAYSGLTAGTRTLSCFVKAGTGTEVTINSYDGIVDKSAIFNVVTGVVISTSAGVTATITNYGSGWYRLTHTYTSAGTSYSCQFFFDDGLTYRVWGMQFEDSASYATSYIPTLGAAVTRGADAASKTGISSLIGQTEGTIFLELNIAQLGITGGEFFIYNGTDVVAIQFPPASPNNIRGIVYVGGGFPVLIDVPYSTTGDYKIAFAYKQNDFALYVNGVLGGTDTSGNVPTCSQFVLSPAAMGGIKQALLFKTRLSNADLAALTA